MRTFLLAVLVLSVSSVFAQQGGPRDGRPGTLVPFANRLYFGGTGLDGHELRSTDGRTVTLVRDLASTWENRDGMYLSALAELSGALYFFGRGSGTLALWRSDGTYDGTVKVVDLPGSEAAGLVRGGGYLYFTIRNGSAHELWRTDGTAPGTFFLQSFDLGLSVPVPIGSFVFFTAAKAGVAGLYRSDATPGGTILLTTGNAGALTEYQGLAHFSMSNAIWKTDGSVGGTVKIADVSARELAVAGGYLYFINSPEKLWRTDGTAAGTVLIRSFLPEASELFGLRAMGTTLFFFGRWGAADPDVDFLWISNGTAAGSSRVKQFKEGTQSLYTGGNLLIFYADDGVHGFEPWRSDGTAAGTFLLEDIQQQGAMSTAGAFPALWWNGHFYFGASDVRGYELWRTNGSRFGTRIVQNLNPEGSFRGRVTNLDTGEPVPFVTVAVSQKSYPSGYSHFWNFRTDENGEYEAGGLSTNHHRAEVKAVGEYYAAPHNGADIFATWTQATAGSFDYRVAQGGYISGTARDAMTGAPREFATVTIATPDGSTVVANVTTDEFGYYKTPLLPSAFYVVYVVTSPFSRSYHQGVGCARGYDPRSATKVWIVPGRTSIGTDVNVEQPPSAVMARPN